MPKFFFLLASDGAILTPSVLQFVNLILQLARGGIVQFCDSKKDCPHYQSLNCNNKPDLF